jgi:hypothetical protein
MTINLSSYSNIEAGLFVKIVCSYYKATPASSPITETLRFSDINRPITVDSASYTGLGKLLTITSSSSEIRATTSEISITISGIPNTSISEIVNSRIKGSKITIVRGIINTSTGQLLSISGNPVGRYVGLITNYSLNEEYDFETKQASNTIVMTASSILDVLGNTSAGRRTNKEDMRKFYPSDESFDNVTKLIGANFNFGAPK